MTHSHAAILQALTDHPTGDGLRPSFHALWHLEELGVVDDLQDFHSAAWTAAEQQAGAPVRVAIIDTPVAHSHPNLKGVIDLGLMRDFSVSDLGSFVLKSMDDPPATAQDRASRDALLAALANRPEPMAQHILSEAQAGDSIRSMRLIFGAHGTALAGLIGARPTTVTMRVPTIISDSLEGSHVFDLELPYCGIDPFCRIVPISVSASGRPEMILGALEYAQMIAPQVVVIADSWDRTQAQAGEPAWQAVDQAFRALCAQCHVLCAGGNDPLRQLVYPANVSGPLAGPAAQGAGRPWAVGACDASGHDLSYSPDSAALIAAGFRMVKTLSTEAPRYDREVQKLDPWAIDRPEYGRPEGDADYPPRDIITTDVPGQAGYNPSPYYHTPGPGGEHYEIASLFCRLSGTSAATAVAGGLVSLALSSGAQPGPGGLQAGLLFNLSAAAGLSGQAPGG